jgi:hypothetical protein
MDRNLLVITEPEAIAIFIFGIIVGAWLLAAYGVITSVCQEPDLEPDVEEEL